MSEDRRIDLNADVGEGSPHDAALLAIVSSANVACGVHAGDEPTMRRTVELAAARGVAVGAHPGLADREGFGRREAAVDARAVVDLVASQVRALARACRRTGLEIAHVKPHGALYNLAARDPAIGAAVIEGVLAAGACRTIYALAGSPLVAQARAAGLLVVEEAFADRGYRGDGTLVPRGSPGDLVGDPAEAARRAVRVAVEGAVESVDGRVVTIEAATLCVHGDSPAAVALAAAVAAALRAAGVTIARPGAAPGDGSR